MIYQPTPEEHEILRRAASHQAAAWLEMRPVYLDTETTGVGDGNKGPLDEIVSIAVVDHDGTVLLDQLVRPRQCIPPAATAIHGITDEHVERMPHFDELWPRLVRVITGRNVVIYNAQFDQRMLNQSMRACGRGAQYRTYWAWTMCAMTLYAQYVGDWNEYRGDYKWHKLSAAAEACGLTWCGAAHGALADAQMTRNLVHYMAAQVP